MLLSLVLACAPTAPVRGPADLPGDTGGDDSAGGDSAGDDSADTAVADTDTDTGGGDTEVAPCATTWWHPDADRDFFGDATTAICAASAPEDGWLRDDRDCDDLDPYVNPLAWDECDLIDNNCDGEVDPASCASSLGLATRVVYGSDDVHIGATVDLPGDLDGDGLGDLALLADQLVFVTVPTGVGTTETPIGTFGDPSDELGRPWPAGDVDGDGVEDLWLPANHTIHLLLGPFVGARTTGESIASWSTDLDVVSGGDADGDGAQDLLAASDGSSADGDVYLLLGVNEALGAHTTAEAALTMTGEVNSSAGSGLAMTDLDGDGLDELVVGASSLDEAGSNAGAVYVVSPEARGTVALADADGRHLGSGAGAYLGSLVVALGDVDGDGLADVAAGEVWGGPDWSGRAYVLSGPGKGSGAIDADAAAVLMGSSMNCAFGYTLAGPGDIGADGYAELVVGAYADDSSYADAGSVFRFDGPLSGAITAEDATQAWAGDNGADQAGRALATGDVGDGGPGLAIGADQHQESGYGLGAVYLLPF